MPCRYGTTPRERLRAEFVEADIEMGFHLVDMAEAELGEGHFEHAVRLIGDAEGVFRDICERLARFNTEAQRLPFTPLLEELRRAIERGKGRPATA